MHTKIQSIILSREEDSPWTWNCEIITNEDETLETTNYPYRSNGGPELGDHVSKVIAQIIGE